ncbi:hypothetical protein EVAR_62773_1 [Eumeta japonica]|uniref:Uncharacterized protein n=1 Tax=Eumeta variegata TaxID=151549 RepID=A0A4C1ZJM9_EUMVA|nr:hypothetical protein EVAR_62773_1 [Eumeta japonica]
MDELSRPAENTAKGRRGAATREQTTLTPARSPRFKHKNGSARSRYNTLTQCRRKTNSFCCFFATKGSVGLRPPLSSDSSSITTLPLLSRHPIPIQEAGYAMAVYMNGLAHLLVDCMRICLLEKF